MGLLHRLLPLAEGPGPSLTYRSSSGLSELVQPRHLGQAWNRKGTAE